MNAIKNAFYMSNIFHKVGLVLSLLTAMVSEIAFAQVQPATYPSGIPMNYIRTWTATAPEHDANNLVVRPLKDVSQSTDYLDGLGRPIQTVVEGSSFKTGNSPKDMVTPKEYDSYGREVHQWLPFASTEANGNFKIDPFEQQAGFMQQQYGAQGETYFYGQTDFEASPINRPFKKYNPGNSWVGGGRGILQGFWLNTMLDSVVMWNVADNNVSGNFGSYTKEGFYPAAQLYKSVITDENGRQTIEFSDKAGMAVLDKKQIATKADDGTGCGHTGWICTYHIYDDLGNQRCVVQPGGVEQLEKNGWDLTDPTILEEQCFRYEYDRRNRLVMKKLVGAKPVFLVYDARDRLVMEQDGNMRKTGNWLVMAYDSLDRPIKTGMLSNGTDFAVHLANAYASTVYPTSVGNLLLQTHYDDYIMLPDNLSSVYNNMWDNHLVVNDNVWPYPQKPLQNNAVSTKGLVTWTQARVLGKPGFVSTVNIYDDQSRIIQSQSQNLTNGIDVATTQYTWSGKPLVEVHKFEKLDGTPQTMVTVAKTSYDDLGRKVQTQEKLCNSLINNNTMTGFKTVSILHYDALGQLEEKQLGEQQDSLNPIQSVTLESQKYEYNIRGWLLGMNRAYVQDVSTAINDNGSGESFTTPITVGPGYYFGFDLGYDKNGVLDSYTHQYNGNIAGTIWKSAHDGQVRKYDYGYDPISRLLNADFNQYSNSGFNKLANIDFSVSNLGYDANGNIMGMQQMGVVGDASVPIDQLKYSYAMGTNKLLQVIDTVNNSSSTLGDFKYSPLDKTSIDYGYDDNGNTIADANKKITGIAYNYLNLPELISVDGKGTVAYLYDAEGNKLQKTTTEGGRVTTTTYLGDAVFQNDTLRSIEIEEGRIRPKATDFVFDYYLKDQLGNTRMTITDDQTEASHIFDATSYYPFGLKMAGISSERVGLFENQYRYNGKELQHKEFNDGSGLELYDYGARMQDPQLGRMWQQDPMAESYKRWTPYNYVANNPVNGIDPDGRDVIFLNATKGAHGTGHASVIIGNSTAGWFYYSLNGTESQSVYGNSHKPDIGTFLGHGRNIRKLIKDANTVNPEESHEYDRFVVLKTTTEEDNAMKVKATEAASVKKYIVVGQSCLNVAKAAYTSVVDGRVGYWHNYSDMDLRNDLMPNTWFENLPETFNHLNTFMNLWGVGNGINFVSPPRPKPIIIVGSTMHEEK